MTDQIQAAARLTHLNPTSVEGQKGNETGHLKEEIDNESKSGVEGEGIHSRHVGQTT